ncbi:C40 family peptidase [uncultured Flavobacterium sp.]|uniref:C40 family peptidase n=1 Tax=uncultured Flavobacterium sp. TaxID=165435 RepID=UPI0030EF30CB
MKKPTLLLFILFSVVFSSCKSSKSVTNTSKSVSKQKNSIVKTAEENLGVKYKFGGTTKSGMDCSGLVYSTFQKFDYKLPRSSYEMANEGKEISKSKAEPGDLIFFKTGGSRKINHVGLITEIKKDEIFFIHSSTSKGVIISSTNEAYYAKAFDKIKRVIE